MAFEKFAVKCIRSSGGSGTPELNKIYEVKEVLETSMNELFYKFTTPPTGFWRASDFKVLHVKQKEEEIYELLFCEKCGNTYSSICPLHGRSYCKDALNQNRKYFYTPDGPAPKMATQ